MIEGIKKNWSLKEFNTFGIDVTAKFFKKINSVEELTDCLDWSDDFGNQVFILGGGSNILLTQNIDKLVVKNDIRGIEVLTEDAESVEVKLGAGEIWHDTVLYCIDQGWAGIENLSLIPGSVGAAPIQNIGAYGVELKDVFVSLEALNINTRKVEVFKQAECEFGYRTSIFKTHQKGKYIITAVVLKLSKHSNINTEYGAINDILSKKNILSPSIRDVSDAVIDIRSSKLPDPSLLGNSGSFFKNPIINKSSYQLLQAKFDTPGYGVDDNYVKVPAGWLIENAGWKGKRVGEVGVHVNQALVLVNYGKGTGEEIVKLAKDIQQSVESKFGVRIEPEVNIL